MEDTAAETLIADTAFGRETSLHAGSDTAVSHIRPPVETQLAADLSRIAISAMARGRWAPPEVRGRRYSASPRRRGCWVCLVAVASNAVKKLLKAEGRRLLDIVALPKQA